MVKIYRKNVGFLTGILISAIIGCSPGGNSYEYYRDEIIAAYEKGKIEKSIALSESALSEYPDGFKHGMLLMITGWIMTDYYDLYENEPIDRIVNGIESLRKAISYLGDSTEQIRSCYHFIVDKSVEFELIDESVLEEAGRLVVLDSLHMSPLLHDRKFRAPHNHYNLSMVHFALGSPRDSVVFHIDRAIGIAG